MNNQTIVELRESDPTANNNNVADWSNTLGDVLTVYNNDEISLKGAFIDSVAQNSGRINVEPDDISAPDGSDLKTKATISMKFSYYFLDWGTSKGNLADRDYLPVSQAYESGRNYVLCDRVSLGGNTISEVNSITMSNEKSDIWGKMGSNKEDPVLFFFIYTTPQGNEAQLQFGIDQGVLFKAGYTGVGSTATGSGFSRFTIDQNLLDANPNCIKSGKLSFPFLAIKNGIDVGTQTIQPDFTAQPSPPKTWHSGKPYPTGDIYMEYEFMEFYDVGLTDIANTDGDLFQPRLVDYSFKIDARDYAPDELAKVISKGFTQTSTELYISDPNAVVDNPLLTTTRSLQELGTAVIDQTGLPSGFQPIPAGTPNTPPFWCRDDGLAICSYVANCDNYVVGTPQFDLQFNQNVGAEGIFQLAQFHAPLVDEHANNICKGIDLGIVAGADNKRVKYIANKNGGILIDSLSPSYLWKDQMKFDTTKLFTNFTVNPKATLGGLANIRTVSFNVVDSENATGNLKSIDVPYQKSAGFDLVVPLQGLDIITPLLEVINAQDSLDGDTALDSGYYLVEIRSNFFTDKRNGHETRKNIMGIVSRFYQQDSFTSSIDGEGTFTYVHKGDPIQISNFGCRILNPNHSLAEGLKPNNSIFLQINRNV